MRSATRLPLVAVALWALGSLPTARAEEAIDPQVKTLMDQLAGEDWTERTTAASVLSQLGPAAVPAISMMLDLLKYSEESRLYRSTVPITLGAIGPPAKSAIPALIELLKTEDPEPDHPEAHLWMMARANAAHALGTIGPANRAPAYAALLDAARDTRGRIRANALASLTTLGIRSGTEAETAVPVLVKALEDWRDLVESQQSAAALLGAIGPPARAAVPALTRALDSRSDEVRAAAAAALKTIQSR